MNWLQLHLGAVFAGTLCPFSPIPVCTLLSGYMPLFINLTAWARRGPKERVLSPVCYPSYESLMFLFLLLHVINLAKADVVYYLPLATPTALFWYLWQAGVPPHSLLAPLLTSVVK